MSNGQKSESRNGPATEWFKPSVPLRESLSSLARSYRDESDYYRGVNNSRARTAWAGLLAAHTWDAFITSTSSHPAIRKHPLSVLQSARLILTGRATDSFSVTRAFIAAEEFKLGGWHCHGLVKWHNSVEGDLGISPAAIVGDRLSKTGYMRCDPVKSVSDVSRYLSKYVLKDTPWEYDIWGTGWGLDKEAGLV